MGPEPLTLDATIRRSDALLSSNLGDDVVMMDIEEGSYYCLQTVAARIWELTDQPVSVGAVCDRLVAEYQVSTEQCQQEVITFLRQMIDCRIVQVVAPANS